MILNTLHCSHSTHHGMTSQIPACSSSRRTMVAFTRPDRRCCITTHSGISHQGLQYHGWITETRYEGVAVPGLRIPDPLVDDIPLRCIDPQLLSIFRPGDNTLVKTPRAFTLDTHSNLGISPSPSSAPAAAAHRDGDYTTVTSTSHQLPPPLSEAPAQRVRPIPSRRKKRSRSHTIPLSAS
jgi:hypothetical protein